MMTPTQEGYYWSRYKDSNLWVMREVAWCSYKECLCVVEDGGDYGNFYDPVDGKMWEDTEWVGPLQPPS